MHLDYAWNTCGAAGPLKRDLFVRQKKPMVAPLNYPWSNRGAAGALGLSAASVEVLERTFLNMKFDSASSSESSPQEGRKEGREEGRKSREGRTYECMEEGRKGR